MEIKRGVIAAAGRGTRFLPVVKGYPKELVAILDKPNIQYLVEEMVGAGIEEIVIIHRHGDNKIKKYFTPDPELEKFLKDSGKEELLLSLQYLWKKVKVWKFIPQGRSLPYGNASPALAAKGFLGSDPFVFMFGDDMLIEDSPGEYVSHLINIFKKYQPAAVMGVQEVPWEEIDRYGSVKYIKDKNYPNRISAIFEKLPIDKALSNFAQFGRFVFSSKLFEAIAKQKLGKGNELWLTDSNNILAKDDIVIAEPIKKGEWVTTGDPLRWLKINIKMGLRNKEMKKDLAEFIKSL